MTSRCPQCTCTSLDGAQAHAVLQLLAADDLDAALSDGLLDGVRCAACAPHCNAQLATACDARVAALSARDRYRARDARLHRRKAEREATRVPKAATTALTPALPTAAADVLARALAKARTPR